MSADFHRLSLHLGIGDGAWPWALAFALAAVLVVLGARAVTNLPRRRAATLLALRAALAVAVVLVALRLESERETVSVSAAPVAIVIDSSASMGVRDQGSGSGATTRLAASIAWLKQRREAIDELARRTSVDVFTTSSGALTPAGSIDELDAVMPAGSTDLAGSLAELEKRHAGRRRPAVLLLSDGADHGALGAAVRARAPGTEPEAASLPLEPGGAITCVAPEKSGFVDRSVALIERDPVGFLRGEITVKARVRSVGLPAGEVPVSLLRGEDVVQVKSVTLGAGESAADVTFRLTAQQVGESLYRVQVPRAAGESVESNDEASFSVRVVRDRIRVLQVVGRPSWDGRFLRELLKRDPAVDLISFFILRGMQDDTNADVDELSLIPFPVAELFDEKIASFDVVIFQNFSLVPHGIEPYADSIARVVSEHGSGLCVIGGDLALGREWAGADLLPVMPARVAQGARFDASPVRLRLGPAGERHPLMALGDEDPASLLAQLPPVSGTHRGLVPKEGASVVLETADAAARPVAIAAEAGAGRVLVMATDGTWRWSLPMAGRTGSARAYERFWENALRWLVKDERSALLLLEADRRALAPGETAEIRVTSRSAGYAPETRVPVSVVIKDGAGQVVREERVETGEDGVARISFEPRLPGVFAVTASAARGSAGPLHLEVSDRTAELADAAVRTDVLEALALATGGRVLSLGERSGLPLTAEREERVESVEVRPLWRTWAAWALVAGLACAEWWLRRRWGLA